MEEDAERQERQEIKKLTKQFQAKEVEKILQDSKIPIDKKISMVYEKAVKSSKEMGSLKKQQILLRIKLEAIKEDIEAKRIELE